MIKRLLIIISAIMPIVVSGQRAVGSWEVYANYLTPEQMLETPEKVYCLSSGSLFSFDKNTEELYQYGIQNVLSEPIITKIFYNSKRDYLVVAYNSGNIDVIQKDGKVINLPDIKDAVLQSDRTINDVSFGEGRIYVATNFGIVVYDDKRWEVKESGLYDKPVKYVAVTDAYIGAYFTNEKKLGFMSIDKTIRYYDNYALIDCSTCTGLRGLKGNVFLGSNTATFSPRKIEFNAEKKTISYNNIVSDANYSGPYENKNGYYIFNTVASGNNKACIKEIDEDYNVTMTSLPSEFSGKVVSMWDNPKHVFVSDNSGVSEYEYADDGTLTMLHDSFKPEAVTSKGVGYLTAGNSGRIYASAHGYSLGYSGDWPKNYNISYINAIENGVIKDITPSGLTMATEFTSSEGYKDGTHRPVSTYNIVEDPDDPDAYFICSIVDGIYKIKDGKELVNYNNTNSTIEPAGKRIFTQAIDIDGKGNLWSASFYKLNMLPAEKRKLNTPTTKEDWVSGFPKASKEWDPVLLACKKSNMVMYIFLYSAELICIDTNGTATTADDKNYTWSRFVDQDGKEWSLSQVYCMTEDANGQVWVGTDQGLFIIPNPSKLTDPNMRIQRIKVPRNDGTNFADYLLEGEPIYSIAIDGVNRKWIGTANSGAYLVSENGSEILEHFTTENSYLPLNTIYAIACDKYSNAVYFGTVAGLVKYNSDAAPASEDYSDVYAYPNPVRPEYNGFITIVGLMEDSLVKIADASGNVFYQGTSQGGMITWDGCDASGNRVKTGVYYVFASQNGNGQSSGAVTKILVVK